MNQHTPRPWFYQLVQISGSGISPRSEAHEVHDAHGNDIPQTEANMRLIAAAPELLAIVKRYMDAYPAFRIKPVAAPGSEKRIEQENLMALEDAARATLAKAEGAA